MAFFFAFLYDDTCILEFLVWFLLRLERVTEQGLNAQHRQHWLSIAFKRLTVTRALFLYIVVLGALSISHSLKLEMNVVDGRGLHLLREWI